MSGQSDLRQQMLYQNMLLQQAQQAQQGGNAGNMPQGMQWGNLYQAAQAMQGQYLNPHI